MLSRERGLGRERLRGRALVRPAKLPGQGSVCFLKSPDQGSKLREAQKLLSLERDIFDLPSSINFRNINGFPKLGPRPITLIGGHPRWSEVVPLYDFLLVINCTNGRISHRFGDVALEISNIATLGHRSCV